MIFPIIKWICRVNKRYLIFLSYKTQLRFYFLRWISTKYLLYISFQLICYPVCYKDSLSIVLWIILIETMAIATFMYDCLKLKDPLWSILSGPESRSGQFRDSSLLHIFLRQKQALIVEEPVRLLKHLESSTWAQPPSTLSPVLSENYTFYNWQ